MCCHDLIWWWLPPACRLRLFILAGCLLGDGEESGPAAATLPESFVRHPGPTEDGVIEVRILRRSTGNKQQAGIEEQQQLHADSEPSRQCARPDYTTRGYCMCWHVKQGPAYGTLHVTIPSTNSVQSIEPLPVEV
ncbi:hypothetical protein CCMA1212_004508 [Trichoderma ghanense]|uniref:Secreted protein n=1 Tax=Trichoderma ghanense TaxID=65468 RepID=A0ABY2H4M3_9HYPO